MKYSCACLKLLISGLVCCARFASLDACGELSAIVGESSDEKAIAVGLIELNKATPSSIMPFWEVRDI